ncbi:MAG: radical SAM family heme chaperone HemW [Chloroflexi bacterium]|nr:radical SAM family heme chaperone HemW [Chloroflexota bacterium]
MKSLPEHSACCADTTHDQASPATLPDEPFGVYVHVPFCRMLCTYCDFVKYKGLESLFHRYVKAVATEAHSWKNAPPAASLFLGGGTPSALDSVLLRQLIESLHSEFSFTDGAEVSVELNPEDVTDHLISGLQSAGVSRVSLGVQTFDDQLLRRVGRLHTSARATAAISGLRDAGSFSVSTDLIYGLPQQTPEGWRDSLCRAVDLGVDHLSCYALTLEHGTPLARHVASGRIHVPDDDTVAEEYSFACQELTRRGFIHYEVSNWARPGAQSVHNSLYWRGANYVGLGAGAVGYVRGMRWRNQPIALRYCQEVEANGASRCEIELLTARERAHELLLLPLRTDAGLQIPEFQRSTGVNIFEQCASSIEMLQHLGFISVDGPALRVPERHWLVLHSITAQLIAAFDAATVQRSSRSTATSSGLGGPHGT